MEEDYLASTIATYNDKFQDYIDRNDAYPTDPDLQEFCKLLKPSSSVLDAGCAFGKATGYLSGLGHHATGIDLSEGFINEARRRNPTLGFTLMDVRSLDFPDGTFDAIWSRATLLHLTDKDIEKALKEYYRVLRSGGHVFVNMKAGSGSRYVQDDYSGQHKRHFTYVSKAKIRLYLENAGFKVLKISTYNDKKRWGGSFRNRWWINTISVKE